MAAAPYIPAKDAEFQAWLLNFSTLLTATPVVYGLLAGDAVIVAGLYTQWNAAYEVASSPGTRTAPTIAAKDAARAEATSKVRPYAQQIRLNAAVSNEDKLAIGVNLVNNTRPPIPAPSMAPALAFESATPFVQTLRYSNPEEPDGKAKPVGAIGVEIHRAVGTVAAVDPDQARYIGTVTKSPFRQTFVAGEVGKQATYFARYVTRSGPGGVASVGPWSAPLTMAII